MSFQNYNVSELFRRVPWRFLILFNKVLTVNQIMWSETVGNAPETVQKCAGYYWIRPDTIGYVRLIMCKENFTHFPCTPMRRRFGVKKTKSASKFKYK